MDDFRENKSFAHEVFGRSAPSPPLEERAGERRPVHCDGPT
jgi:hypothetical protein